MCAILRDTKMIAALSVSCDFSKAIAAFPSCKDLFFLPECSEATRSHGFENSFRQSHVVGNVFGAVKVVKTAGTTSRFATLVVLTQRARFVY